jgi:outer membrane usher protein
MIARLLLAAVLLAATTPICAALTADDALESLHVTHCSVRLDGVQVAENAAVYLSDDDIIYVSSTDLDAWNLKHPLKGVFTRDGLDYYALQTDLNLATSFDRSSHELEITASKQAFVGQRAQGFPLTSSGSGTYLNYSLTRESGSYDLFSAGSAGIFQMRYVSTTENGFELHRSRTRWFRPNPVSHTILQFGDATTDGGWLGISAPFAGVHWASDFTADPAYDPRGAPSVSGIAPEASLLEVYVDNILELRRDVPQGPFTVRDLPASAAHSDIVMVLTGASGKQTFQVARPSYDPAFLGKGLSAFSFDAGIAHENVDLKGSYYRGGVFTTMYRHGLTDRITGEVYAESINGERFADAGADIQLGDDETVGFRIGGGNQRHASQYEYTLRRGKFRVRELFAATSLAAEPFSGADFSDVIAQIRETSEIGIDFSRNLGMLLRLDRSRENSGFDSSVASMRTRYRRGPLTIELTPFYDFVRRRMSGNVLLTFRVDDSQRVNVRGAINTQSQTSGALEYKKDPIDPSDPISVAAKISSGRTQDRRLFISDEMPWAGASINVQQLYGHTIFEPELYGTLAYVGGEFLPLRKVSEGESFGILRIPGLRNVRVSVNSSEVGRTDSRGDLVLRDLAPFRDNAIAISTEDLPLNVNIADPQHVVPARSTPVALDVPVLSRGAFIVRIVNDRGTPLDPGSDLIGANGRYPVGYAGRTFLTGLGPGKQQLTGTIAGTSCVAYITVPPNFADIVDLGQIVCR